MAVLLTTEAHLGHPYLDRLETVVDGLADHRRGPIRAVSHPYVRSVWVFDGSDRTWAGSVNDLVARDGDVDEALLEAVEAAVSPADPMVVVYSSGSTADPKGAVHTHGAVLRHGPNLGRFRELASGDRVYTPMPQAVEIWTDWLSNGGDLALSNLRVI